MRKYWLTIGLAGTSFGALVLSSACAHSEKVRAKGTAAPETPTVAVAKATSEDLTHGLVLTAEFTPFQEVDVMAKVSGYVKKINVDVGDHVQRGQLLATLEIPEMANDAAKAQASLDRSAAEVGRAKDEVTRAEAAHQMVHVTYQRLADVLKQRPGLIAQQEIDDAHSKDLVAEAQVAAAKSNLSAATQMVSISKAEQGRTATMFDYTRVTAPFSGVVTKRFANTGSMIQAGTSSQTQAMPVVRISENSLLRLILPVPESAVPGVHVGQQVEVRVPTLKRTFPGKVARFADKLQTATRTMETEVDVPNPRFVLVPGMYAEVDLTTEQRTGALSIPIAAVDADAENAGSGPRRGRVLVVGADGRIEPRRVALGMETANRVELLSGVRQGELVVIGNRANLQAGQQVRAKPVTMAVLKDSQ